MGGSYGGYATLVGLAVTPDVFRCGVDLVGPSNLLTLFRATSSPSDIVPEHPDPSDVDVVRPATVLRQLRDRGRHLVGDRVDP